MGSNEAPNEKPPHEHVVREAFCLGKTEVTVAQWDLVMNDGSPTQAADALQMPRTSLNWSDVEGFITRLNQRQGQDVFFVPSEEQWEYAARAASVSRYSFGDQELGLPLYGNCKSNNADGYEGLAPVGSFLPNAWGLYDMYGNASEWVADLFDYYDRDATARAKDGAVGNERVRRGGSYNSSAENCRSAFRTHSKPDSRRSDYGLRVARKVKSD